MKFQYYSNRVDNPKPLGYISIEQFIRATKQPKNNVIEIFQQIYQAEKDGNIELKAKLKQENLHYFTPCVNLSGGRSYNDIIRFTGLMVLDFDHLRSKEYAIQFRDFIFNEYNQIVVAWLSPSKLGVKCLVSIPIAQTVEQFKEYYFGIASDMDRFDGFDGSGQNSVLPLFQSYDPELLFRNNYTAWTIRGIKKNAFVSNLDKKDRIIKMIASGMDNIHDNGHPQLRSLCVAVGGYVASGYIEENEALQFINALIVSHRYLSKGVTGYQKTAKQMIEFGKCKPIIL